MITVRYSFKKKLDVAGRRASAIAQQAPATRSHIFVFTYILVNMLLLRFAFARLCDLSFVVEIWKVCVGRQNMYQDIVMCGNRNARRAWRRTAANIC